jgi:glycosyltransferase involved in cell wall biosynthesis
MKILLTSTQHPGNGGAATNLYKLNKYLLNKKAQVYCLFFLCNKENTDLINIDPDNLNNVSYIRCFWKDGRLLNYDKNTNQYIEYSNDYISNFKNKIINYLGGEPDIIWAKNYMAPITSKILFPNSKIYYLVSGVYFMSLLNNFNDEDISAQKVLQNWDLYEEKINSYKNEVSYTNIEQELKTIKLVDRIIFNSTLTKQLMKLFYKDSIKNYEIKNTSLLKDLNNNDSNDFTQREYDIIFICSNFNRKIKNPNFVKELFLDKRLDNYNKIVMGNGDLFDGLPIKNLTVMKQQPNSVVLDYMKKSKLLLLPSLFDSSPNTLYEAIECGCNILTSKNIGNWELFNPESICDDVYNKNKWFAKIENNLIKQISNHLKREDIFK